MRTTLNNNEIFTKISELENDEVVFQILQYDELAGGKDVETAVMVSFMKQAKIKLRQLRIILNDSAVKIESGSLSFLKGNIEMKTKVGGIVGLGKKIFANKVTGESVFKPIYEGSGQLYLEPTFGHFALLELEDEAIVVDDGLFYACQNSVEVGVEAQKSLSAGLFGREGVFQTRIEGSGMVALELPVPETEVLKFKLFNDTLKVDGNFAVLRTANIDFSVEKSSKSLVSTVAGGEGLLNVFRGTGEVWLVPTQHVYANLKNFGIRSMSNPSGSMGINTSKDE